ncbi:MULTISPECIES: hypothetical protein [unclassified Cyanobium]|uniref:hypothetical protein n=1 Tax=unclassified Cyanobium TaxID=2627006 RepID=UPI0020CC1C72|nr:MULTISPECIES: hypothetical protein [unclassified Cyanobium]MCP9776714.1 hypothetical protein [Cyanobium sp. Tous-M-B4]MCP9875874.1 hypothetical protein [Cyanobium sp. A2C-AMD]
MAKPEKRNHATEAHVQLTKRSSVLKEAKAGGKVMINSAFFDIKSGKVSLLD